MAAYLQRLRAPGALPALLADATGKRQKIVIDYSSPNIAKQFHIGNLRSTLVGAYLDRIHRTLGHEVVSVNYLGDWGTQFALIATYWPQIRPSDAYWKSLNDVDKIRSLTDCYVVANKRTEDDETFRQAVRETFIKMEQNIMRNDFASEEMKLWQDIRSISQRHLKEFYTLLNINFDKWICESEMVTNAHKEVDRLLGEEKLRKTDAGLLILDHPSSGSNSKKQLYSILRKSDSTSLYLTRDVASILERDRLFQGDRYLYVVDKAQRQHFDALKIVLDRMGQSELAAKIEHVPFGRVKGLSTRRGKTEAVGDIIRDGTELALDFMKGSKTIKVPEEARQKVAEQLSVSTIIFNDLKRARCSEYEFSFKNAFALNHNNALLLQTKHSRMYSIEARNAELVGLLEACQSVPDGTEEVVQLVQLLSNVGATITSSAEQLEPCQLTLYLIQLSQSVGKVAAQLQVKGQSNEVAAPRLLLLSAARHVLADGMRLLGMSPVDQM